jgi:hypothetical protein
LPNNTHSDRPSSKLHSSTPRRPGKTAVN